MDDEAAIQIPEPPPEAKENWEEAEWFQVWLRLARREYHGPPGSDRFRQAA